MEMRIELSEGCYCDLSVLILNRDTMYSPGAVPRCLTKVTFPTEVKSVTKVLSNVLSASVENFIHFVLA